jgi:predicted permease
MRPALHDLAADLRVTWRRLRRTPAFTITAVLTLGLGIAAQTTFFTFVNALLFKPIPGARLDGVYRMSRIEKGKNAHIPLSAFRSLERELPERLRSIAAAASMPQVLVQTPGRAESLRAEGVSVGYAPTLDLRAQLGRWFEPDDDRGALSEMVAVVSDGFWREWLGADRQAAGRATIRVNRTPLRVIGVAPSGFTGLNGRFGGVAVWVPVSQAGRLWRVEQPVELDRIPLFVFARPAARIALPAVAGDLNRRLATPGSDPGVSRVALTPLSEVLRPPELVMAASVLMTFGLLILLAACANLGNMLYARGAQRAGETAVRMSLGARPAAVVREAIVETMLLAMLSAGVGLVIALALSWAFSAAFPTIRLDRFFEIALDLSPDWRVFVTAFGTGLVAAVLVALATAWRASRILPARALSPSGVSSGVTRSGGRLRTALVAVQVTVAVLLVMVAGLAWEGARAASTRSGLFGFGIRFDADRVLTGRVDLRLHGYTDSAAPAFFTRVMRRVADVPGVERVALADGVPGLRSPSPRFTIFERPVTRPAAGVPPRARSDYAYVSPGLLATIGIDLVGGRDFGPSDGEGAPPVAIVSRSFAEALWPNADPVGRTMVFANDTQTITIVGLCEDPVVSADTSERNPARFVFLPLARRPQSALLVVARSATPLAVAEPLRAAIRAIDEEVAITELASVEAAVADIARPYRLLITVVVTVGVVALALALLGVYGVVAYFVSTRTREFGIRLAIGATPGRIRTLVFDYTVHIVLIGLLPGVFLAASVSRWIESRQFELMPNQISTWVAVPLLILVAGIVAGHVPARRAARVDPNVALRDL